MEESNKCGQLFPRRLSGKTGCWLQPEIPAFAKCRVERGPGHSEFEARQTNYMKP